MQKFLISQKTEYMGMSSKKQAERLIDEFYSILGDSRLAKSAAMLCCNKIGEHQPELSFRVVKDERSKQYWEQVKQEILNS